MRIISISFFCFLVPFVGIAEKSEIRKSKCLVCETVTQSNTYLNLRYYCKQRNTYLNPKHRCKQYNTYLRPRYYNTYLSLRYRRKQYRLRYCPYCVKKYRGVWRYFIDYTKNKQKHIDESYASQYTPLNFINKDIYKTQVEHYEETVFLEFIQALHNKLFNKNYSFKNPDLENLFSTLLDQEENLLQNQQYSELLRFYCKLKWIYVALYYECQPNLCSHSIKKMISLLGKINETIKFLSQYQYQYNGHATNSE